MTNNAQHNIGWFNYVILFLHLNKVWRIWFLPLEYSIDVHGIILPHTKYFCIHDKNIAKRFLCDQKNHAHAVITLILSHFQSWSGIATNRIRRKDHFKQLFSLKKLEYCWNFKRCYSGKEGRKIGNHNTIGIQRFVTTINIIEKIWEYDQNARAL